MITRTVAFLATLSFASPALADFICAYSGSTNPTNSRDGGIVNYVDLHAPLTFDFTVSAALVPNLTHAFITSSITGWNISAGKAQSMISSPDPHALLSTPRLNTDASGNLTAVYMVASAWDAALPGISLFFQLDQFYFSSLANDSIKFIENAHG